MQYAKQEIAGKRCTIVEKGVSAIRLDFLKKLLEYNQFEVVVVEEAHVVEAPATYTLGVTDLLFNPVIAVYEMSLKTENGKKVSPAYWEQNTTEIVDEYWDFVKK